MFADNNYDINFQKCNISISSLCTKVTFDIWAKALFLNTAGQSLGFSVQKTETNPQLLIIVNTHKIQMQR